MPEPSAWRLDKRKWAHQSFDGIGASLEGGRWNSAGVRAVYVSQHLATAVLEKFIHLPKPHPRWMRLVKFALDFGSLPITRLALSTLPRNWKAQPVPASTQAIGDVWIASARTAILQVPCVHVPEELNFVLNPAHPDFHKIGISRPSPFDLPPRLGRLVDPSAH